MKLTALFCSLAMLVSVALADEPAKVETAATGLVSVEARGTDVRNVLHDLFTQAKRNYVLDPGVRFVLYLNLREVEFEEALGLILRNAGLIHEIQNGIYFVSRARSGQPTLSVQATPTAPSTPSPRPEAKPEVKPEPKPEVRPPAPRGPLSRSVLDRRVTTRFQKADFRVVMADLTRQTGVTFEIAADIPAYKLDAFLINTSLKFALDTITRAAGLTYTFTQNQSIAIQKAEESGRVEVVGRNTRG